MKKYAVSLSLVVACWLSVSGFAPQPVACDEQKTLVLGTYELDRYNPVTDGDTIRVWGLREGIRLLCVDTEETFKSLDDRKNAGINWDAYQAAKEADQELPVKYGTFMGEEAAHFARDFFRGVKEVRLEYDTLSRKKGFFGRHLCYVFATPAGKDKEANFCVELVRQGYSPYSMKYGHSERFRKEFEAAQKEAREAKRGIWREKPMGYRDYETRLAWWGTRGDQIDKYRAQYAKTANAIELGNDNTAESLEANVGKDVVLFGSVGEHDSVFAREDPPYCVIAAQRDVDVNVRFKSAELIGACGPEKLLGYFVIVKGTLQRDGKDWQVLVEDAKQFKKAEVK
ncbi:MAG: thermonuclease family protein [Planctomycetes bacterium]|nr:thermonuclease family protein [Planctomycetota bacterium]MCA8936240.1 thermonuclease family protein [Planctomycetota bacterium]